LDTTWNLADLINEKAAVKRNNLGNVDNRLLAKPRDTVWQQNVAWCARKRKVARNCSNHHSTDAALIEGIGLNDEHRSRKSWFRTTRLWQVHPPYLAASQI